MSIQNILQKEEFKNFKFNSAQFKESENECVLTFLYPENLAKPSVETKQKLANELGLLIKNICKTRVKFRQSFIDEDIIYNAISVFLDKEIPILKSLILKDDIKFEKVDENINITISCDKTAESMLRESNKLLELTKFLSNCFFEDVTVNLEKIVKNVLITDDIEDISPNADLFQCLEEENKINKIQIEILDSIFGKLITKSPVFISDIVLDDKETTVAGIVSNILLIDFVPKLKKEHGLEETKKKYSFTLTDSTGSVEIVIFPNENMLKDLERVEEGSQLVVMGTPSSFGNRTSLRASSLAFCNLITKEKTFVWRKAKEKYLCVKPQPMHDMVQMDLFSNNSTKNQEWWNEHKSVVVFDFETTGLNAENCNIIEIGAVKVINGVCVETFSTLVNPATEIPDEIQNITGITNTMVSNAPTIDMVLPDFYKFTQGSVLSAYNIAFDNKFLQINGKKLRLNFNNEKIDALELARQKVVSLHNYKLGTVVKALGIVLEDAHRALNDAIATAKVFIKLI